MTRPGAGWLRDLSVTSCRTALNSGDATSRRRGRSMVGLPPQLADQIFNAVFTTKVHGTGMGLSISRSIVASHDDRLWAADNSPRGREFSLHSTHQSRNTGMTARSSPGTFICVSTKRNLCHKPCRALILKGSSPHDQDPNCRWSCFAADKFRAGSVILRSSKAGRSDLRVCRGQAARHGPLQQASSQNGR